MARPPCLCTASYLSLGRPPPLFVFATGRPIPSIHDTAPPCFLRLRRSDAQLRLGRCFLLSAAVCGPRVVSDLDWMRIPIYPSKRRSTNDPHQPCQLTQERRWIHRRFKTKGREVAWNSSTRSNATVNDEARVDVVDAKTRPCEEGHVRHTYMERKKSSMHGGLEQSIGPLVWILRDKERPCIHQTHRQVGDEDVDYNTIPHDKPIHACNMHTWITNATLTCMIPTSMHVLVGHGVSSGTCLTVACSHDVPFQIDSRSSFCFLARSSPFHSRLLVTPRRSTYALYGLGLVALTWTVLSWFLCDVLATPTLRLASRSHPPPLCWQHHGLPSSLSFST